MKKVIFLFALFLAFISCNLFQSDEEIVKENIIEKLKPSLRNPDSFVFESIEFIQVSEKEELHKELKLVDAQSNALDRESKNRTQDEIIESITLLEKSMKLRKKYNSMEGEGKIFTEAILYYRAENGFGGMSKGAVQARLNDDLEVERINEVTQ